MNRRRGRRLADLQRLTLSMLLPFGLALILMPAAGGAATAHRALQGVENSYTDPVFGWSITWDPETWTMGGEMPTPANDDGVSGSAVAIAGLDPMVGGVFVSSQTSVGDDLAACLDAVAEQIDPFVGGITVVRKADRELPEAPADAEQELSRVQFSGYDGLLYTECRPLVEDKALLGIAWILPDAAGYKAALPVFEELIAGLDLSEVQSAGEGEGVKKETFTDPLHGWSIDYDPRAWELDGPMQETADDENGDRVVTRSGAGLWGLTFDTRGNVYIFGETAYGDDTAACLDALRETHAPGDIELSEADLDPPTAPEDAEWELYLATSSFVSVLYIACMPLVEGESLLSIAWDLGDAESYEQALPDFEALLAGLDLSEVHPAAAVPVEDEEEGESYTDPTFDWTIAWDPATWTHYTAVNANDPSDEDVAFDGYHDGTVLGSVFISNETAYGGDTEACLAAYSADPAGLLEHALTPPAAPNDAASELFLFTLGHGLGEGVIYVECRPLVEDEAVLSIIWVLDEPAAYQVALPLFEDLIAGLELPDGQEPDEAADDED